MKNAILFIGVLFCMLMAMSSYAQETTKYKQTEMKQKEMKQIKVIPPSRVKVVPKKERVIHGRIDPITGEEILPDPILPPYKELIVVYPPKGLQYPNSTWFVLDRETIVLDGEATSGHTLEVKMLRKDNENYRVVQDWTSFNVRQDGIWIKHIAWNGVADGQSVKLKIMVRDIADRSKVKTVFVGRE